jgi:hypothetical protein
MVGYGGVNTHTDVYTYTTLTIRKLGRKLIDWVACEMSSYTTAVAR